MHTFMHSKIQKYEKQLNILIKLQTILLTIIGMLNTIEIFSILLLTNVYVQTISSSLVYF